MTLPKVFETISDTYTRFGSIGNGAVGTVFEVNDENGAVYALKLFTPNNNSSDLRKRFSNELGFTLRSRHPNIVRSLDSGFVSGETGKLPFYVMAKYFGTLRRLITDGIPIEKVIPYFLQILEGVRYLHGQKCWHRDLKPENILYDDGTDSLLIADFGAAHFADEELHTLIETKPNSKLANFKYAAPEQKGTGQLVDHRADIFSLGLILNEMFTGEVIQGQGHKSIESIDPDYVDLDAIVNGMIQQDPSNRPATIDAIRNELAEVGFKPVEPGKNEDLSSMEERDFTILKQTTNLPCPSLRSKRMIRSLVSDSTQAAGELRDYFESVLARLPNYDFPAGTVQLTDQNIVDKIYEITPLRDELIDVLVSVNKYKKNQDCYETIHEFFEQLIPFLNFRDQGDSNTNWATDHYKVFINEIFVYTMAAGLKWKRFDQLNVFTEQDYFVRAGQRYSSNQAMAPFYDFGTYSEALQFFKTRTNPRLYSIQGDLMQKRSTHRDVQFEELLQADFLLYLLYNLDRNANSHRVSQGRWYPHLAPYMQQRNRPFEVFAKSQSIRFFDRFRSCLRNTSKSELSELLDKLIEGRQNLFQDSVYINLKALCNISMIAVAP